MVGGSSLHRSLFSFKNSLTCFILFSDIPVLLLYYQETDYSAGHYQSLERILDSNCSLISHYNFKLTQETLRISTLPPHG